jgi:hypothetical protein
MPDVAEAAAVAEDEKGADVGPVLAIGAGADAALVEEDLGFVGGAGVI